MPEPIPYSPADEVIDPDEGALFARIADAMRSAAVRAPKGGAPGDRVGHLKTLAALEGELVVAGGLDAALAQGVFARPGRYRAVARLSHLPGERLDDRGVSGPRGLAVRLFDVPGPRLDGAEGAWQDLVLETGRAFNASTPASFLALFGTVEAAAVLPEGAKAAVSATARGANAALSVVGLRSANLDVLGHPRRHPLGEAFYSQAPLRWGDYVAKVGVFPATGQRGLEVEADGPDALRRAVAAWCGGQGAEFVVAAQLRTDAAAMPIEDASAVWPEALSPYRPVGRLVFPPQDPHAPEREAAVDALAFSPGNAVEAHRPLGGIMRARVRVYEALAGERRAALRREA